MEKVQMDSNSEGIMPTVNSTGSPRFLLLYPPNLLVPSFVKKAMLPMGIAYLAAVLRNKEIDVDVIDCVIEGIDGSFTFNETDYYGLPLEEIRERISQGSYDVVGVSCQFSALCEISVEICKIAKECDVDYVIAGGPHASAQPESLLLSDAVDYVFVGEAEGPIAKFADCLAKGDTAGIKNIDGIAYVKGQDVHVPSNIPFIEDIDEIPFPARDMFPLEKYFAKSSPAGGVFKSKRNLPIITSRGCPSKCNFCASSRFWGKKYRARSLESVLGEIQELRSVYGVEEIQIEDDNFTLNKKRAIEICDAIKEREPGLFWSVPAGLALWTVDKEVIDAMSDAGCHYVAVAIESGNQRVLKEVINKPIKLEKVPELCRHFKKRKIKLSAFFVVGFPDETLDEIKDTFEFASKCNLDNANFFFAAPLPGTPLWTQAVGEDLFIEGFSLKDVKFDRPSLKSNNWTLQELMSVVLYHKKKFFLKTFLRRPRVLIFRILEMLRKDPRRLLSVIYNQLFSTAVGRKNG